MDDRIFLLLGSNQGHPPDRLAEAAERIGSEAGEILARSSLYRSAAWGLEQQPDFCNQVLELRSELPPALLLETLLGIERAMGRIRSLKWGPRVIDIDLLFYGQQVIDSATLHLPHPGIPERKFTLLPLSEIAPDWIHPVSHKSIATLLEECPDPLRVEKVGSSQWSQLR